MAVGAYQPLILPKGYHPTLIFTTSQTKHNLWQEVKLVVELCGWSLVGQSVREEILGLGLQLNRSIQNRTPSG